MGRGEDKISSSLVPPKLLLALYLTLLSSWWNYQQVLESKDSPRLVLLGKETYKSCFLSQILRSWGKSLVRTLAQVESRPKSALSLLYFHSISRSVRFPPTLSRIFPTPSTSSCSPFPLSRLLSQRRGEEVRPNHLPQAR